jgi:hypothetical protein
MRAGDAAGERGGPGDEQDPAGPPFGHGARCALGEQERGARVHRQHLIELGGGDVLRRLEMAQPKLVAERIYFDNEILLRQMRGEADAPTGLGLATRSA